MTYYDAKKDAAESYDAALKAIRMAKIKAGEINPIVREVTIGNCRLIQGDCLDVMPTLGRFDAVVTDPPYGIGEDGGAQRTRGRKGYSKHKKKDWDKSRPAEQVFPYLASAPSGAIIWGGNYFADLLPPTMGWLYWRKLMGGDFSDGELAWTSRKGALREFVKCPKGMDKSHPCQKPVELMEWCLGFLPDAQTILDPFMGSGTTLVACAKMGRKGIGIELDPDYFDIAVERVRKAYEQPDFFIEQSKQPEPQQEDMGL